MLGEHLQVRCSTARPASAADAPDGYALVLDAVLPAVQVVLSQACSLVFSQAWEILANVCVISVIPCVILAIAATAGQYISILSMNRKGGCQSSHAFPAGKNAFAELLCAVTSARHPKLRHYSSQH
jgi:hypothetical protein